MVGIRLITGDAVGKLVAPKPTLSVALHAIEAIAVAERTAKIRLLETGVLSGTGHAVENVQGGKVGAAAQAVPEVDSKPRVPRPQ